MFCERENICTVVLSMWTCRSGRWFFGTVLNWSFGPWRHAFNLSDFTEIVILQSKLPVSKNRGFPRARKKTQSVSNITTFAKRCENNHQQHNLGSVCLVGEKSL